uniref:Hydroxymethylpyrimidine pyrophosphatase n=1 Tax=Candidatus Kentrum sp. LFY TaxID=2126342 RepID=A0A450U9D2_9GAMM|nr:MAG: Hydroxymethylpyrimidine pyrophosphatase [Candidatus Kentron sp. LFY]
MQIHNTFLFASELDGALLPNGTFTAAAGCLERTGQLLERLKAADYPVAYVTDHDLSSAREGQGIFGLPEPSYWVCNLGTEIYDAAGNPDEDWKRTMGPPFDKKTLWSALKENSGLTPQEDGKQGSHKFGFYCSEPDDALRAWISTRIEPLVEGARLIQGIEASSQLTSFDLIPVVAGGARALAHLAEKLGLPSSRVFFSGGGESDLDALMSGVCGTLVGNTAPAIQDRARELAESREGARLTLSRGYYGDGIIEGLRIYNFLA